jgi:uncharacterized protein YlxP (DUF503 family)
MISVAFLKLALSMPGCGSVRDKRRIVKSILARVRSRFNVSGAETGDIGQASTSVLAFTVCGAETAIQRVVLERVRAFVERNADAEVVDTLFVVPAFVDDLDGSALYGRRDRSVSTVYDVFVESPGEGVMLSKVVRTMEANTGGPGSGGPVSGEAWLAEAENPDDPRDALDYFKRLLGLTGYDLDGGVDDDDGDDDGEDGGGGDDDDDEDGDDYGDDD